MDLPGYGFAKVPKRITEKWKELIESYLLGRGALGLAVILVDARRGWMEKDVRAAGVVGAARAALSSWPRRNLTSSDRRKNGIKAGRPLRQGYAGELLECSAVTGRGVREIWQAISKIQNSPSRT